MNNYSGRHINYTTDMNWPVNHKNQILFFIFLSYTEPSNQKWNWKVFFYMDWQLLKTYHEKRFGSRCFKTGLLSLKSFFNNGLPGLSTPTAAVPADPCCVTAVHLRGHPLAACVICSLCCKNTTSPGTCSSGSAYGIRAKTRQLAGRREGVQRFI